MESDSPLVSIIVPVFKVEQYLEKCLDSIVGIKYSPIEVVLVDDCSPDRCGAIIDRYVETNENWIGIHKRKNEGVARARVTGLENASGDFVMFVDSDDYVSPDILSKLVKTAMENNADVSCCGVSAVIGSRFEEDKRNIDHVYDGEELSRLVNEKLLYDRYFGQATMPVYLVGKLYRNKHKELIRSLEEGLELDYQEDMIAAISFFVNSVKRLACISDVLYYYVKRPGSLTDINPVKLYDNNVILWNRVDRINNPGLKDQLRLRMWSLLKTALYSMYHPNSFSDYKAFIRKVRSEPIVSKYIYDSKLSNLPDEMKRHPHFFLIKSHLYWLDYKFSGFIYRRG